MRENELDDSIEIQTRKAIYEYLSSQHQINLEKNVDELMDVNGGFSGRFEYFDKYLREFHKRKLLISGCAIGSEMIVAKRYGFSEIHGTEVSQALVRIGNAQLSKHQNMSINCVSGNQLPYPDESFSMVCSGHVIEHTSNPFFT